MDINDLRGISTALIMVAFIGLIFWSFSSKQKKSFDEAANLPFADDAMDERTMKEVQNRD
jgi:cytochrome c oxidase cbb3-type subunit 4